jgi:limonene-1,2-epoxide hydrolase
MTNPDSEEIIRRFLDLWGDGEIEIPDFAPLEAMIAEDIVWHLWMPDGPIVRGREAAMKDAERQFGFATYLKCGIRAISSSGNTVITERLDTFRSYGATISVSLCAVFEVDADGRISGWREYYDLEGINRQIRAARAKFDSATA